MDLEQIFEKTLKESQFSIESIDDGVIFLTNWNNRLSLIIDDIGYTEEILIENFHYYEITEKEKKEKEEQEKRKIDSVVKDVGIKVLNLSKMILLLSSSIDVLTRVKNKLDIERHEELIIQIDSGVDIINTIHKIINLPYYKNLSDILLGLEKNFTEFYNKYITALDTADPDKLFSRPKKL